jgi:hypothetical protein
MRFGISGVWSVCALCPPSTEMVGTGALRCTRVFDRREPPWNSMGWAGRYGEYLKSVRLLENNYVMPQKDEIIGHVKRFLYSKHAASHAAVHAASCACVRRVVARIAVPRRPQLVLNARSRRCCMLPVRLAACCLFVFACCILSVPCCTRAWLSQLPEEPADDPDRVAAGVWQVNHARRSRCVRIVSCCLLPSHPPSLRRSTP